jgi:hypothetical protein
MVEDSPEGRVDIVGVLEQGFIGMRDAHVPNGGQVTFESVSVKDRRVLKLPTDVSGRWDVGIGCSRVLGSQRRRSVNNQPALVLTE